MCKLVSAKKHSAQLELSMDPILSSFSKNFTAQITNYFENSVLLLFGFITKLFKRMPKKITPRDFTLMMVIASFRNKPSSLLEMSSILHELNPKFKISPQSLSERINSPESPHFFQRFLEHVLKAKIQKLPSKNVLPSLLNSFNRVLLEDSSKFELSEELKTIFKGQGGNASKSALKMHTLYDITKNSFILMKEYGGTISDQVLGRATIDVMGENDLLIRDQGFFNIKYLKQISIKKAFYLTRLPSNVVIRLTAAGECISFSKLFKEHTLDGAKLDVEVFIGEKREEAFKVRLVAYRVPEKVSNERRRLLHKNARHRGIKIAEETLSRQNFTILVTNVDVEMWPLDVIETIYRIRWEIELIYKSWKSQLRIHYFHGTRNVNRLRSLLYAKWSAIIICSAIYGLILGYAKEKLGREASLHKLVNWLLIGNRFQELLKGRSVNQLLRKLLEGLSNGLCKDKRKNRKSTMSLLEKKQPLYALNYMQTKALVS